MAAGVDSLAAVELRSSLQSHFNLDLSATIMFDYPTVSALAGFIASELMCNVQQAQGVQVVQGQATKNAMPQLEIVLNEVQAAVAEILGSAVAPDQPLMGAGMDSLGELARPYAPHRSLGGGVCAMHSRVA